jgi:hypothetical protein
MLELAREAEQAPGSWRTYSGGSTAFYTTRATQKLLDELYESGVLQPAFDWCQWSRRSELETDRNALDSASALDVARLITSIVARDRFAEGAFGAAVEQGLVTAALERLAELTGPRGRRAPYDRASRGA